MKKNISEMVFPEPNYTDKIHRGLNLLFHFRPWLSFTIPQVREHLIKEYLWLANRTPAQEMLLNKLINTGIKKLVQSGVVKKVVSKTSVEGQWQLTETAVDSGYTIITSSDEVASTEAARHAIKGRSISDRDLIKLNQTA